MCLALCGAHAENVLPSFLNRLGDTPLMMHLFFSTIILFMCFSSLVQKSQSPIYRQEQLAETVKKIVQFSKWVQQTCFCPSLENENEDFHELRVCTVSYLLQKSVQEREGVVMGMLFWKWNNDGLWVSLFKESWNTDLKWSHKDLYLPLQHTVDAFFPFLALSSRQLWKGKKASTVGGGR